ncbi:MAG: proton-conducting transporter membrane subunit [Planctomycetota bacterium]|jgi:formate hydrogenlyase subunit 3/multisubunit Na+/H+ antiporter MnhD subunit
MSRAHDPSSPLAIGLSAAGAGAMWWSPNHAVFTAGLLTLLGVALMRSCRLAGGGGTLRELHAPLLVFVVALLHGIWPFSAPIALVALGLVGAAFPAQLWLESLRGRLPSNEFLLLLLAQPGLALAVHILGPQTVTLDANARLWLSAWFVIGAIVQTGLSLVRSEPERAVFALGLSQASLLIAGAMVSTQGYDAEYSMLIGADLGLAGLVMVVAELQRRYPFDHLAPDNGLAESEPTLARLFLVIGWFFSGLPGGVIFFAEDLVFHALVEHSNWLTAGMIFVSAMNGVGFYRVYLGVFSGRTRPGLSGSGRPRVWLPFVLRSMLVTTLVFGLVPQLLLWHAGGSGGGH